MVVTSCLGDVEGGMRFVVKLCSLRLFPHPVGAILINTKLDEGYVFLSVYLTVSRISQ